MKCFQADCKRRLLPVLQLLPCLGCQQRFCDAHRMTHREQCSLAKKADADARAQAADRLMKSASAPSHNYNEI